MNNVSLSKFGRDVIVLPSMKTTRPDSVRKLQIRFRLCFQAGLREFLDRRGSVAEGFGIVWEQTLNKVPLPEDVQGRVYWELLNWAKGDELFTATQGRAMLNAWRETVYDF